MKFIAENDALTIKLQGFEVFFGLRRKIILPRKDIENLEWTPEFSDKEHLLRIGGASVPRLLFSGNFQDLNTRQPVFLYVRKPRGLAFRGTLAGRDVLIVTMREGHYRQVIVNCRPEIGVALTKWWHNI